MKTPREELIERIAKWKPPSGRRVVDYPPEFFQAWNKGRPIQYYFEQCGYDAHVCYQVTHGVIEGHPSMTGQHVIGRDLAFMPSEFLKAPRSRLKMVLQKVGIVAHGFVNCARWHDVVSDKFDLNGGPWSINEAAPKLFPYSTAVPVYQWMANHIFTPLETGRGRKGAKLSVSDLVTLGVIHSLIYLGLSAKELAITGEYDQTKTAYRFLWVK